MLGTLYVIATPIGNLKDITLRALEILKVADVIFAEDTRVTQKLLTHYEIRVPVRRYNEHLPKPAVEEVIRRLRNVENVAVVSDAGTPGISDPGSVLVSLVRETIPGAQIIAIPGASAVITALSVSGLAANKFTFLGYPPIKNKRRKFFAELKNIAVHPIVIYESPHRLQKTLEELKGVFGENNQIFISKELTKIYETNFKGNFAEATSYFTGNEGKPAYAGRGEFVIIIP